MPDSDGALLLWIGIGMALFWLKAYFKLLTIEEKLDALHREREKSQ